MGSAAQAQSLDSFLSEIEPSIRHFSPNSQEPLWEFFTLWSFDFSTSQETGETSLMKVQYLNGFGLTYFRP